MKIHSTFVLSLAAALACSSVSLAMQAGSPAEQRPGQKSATQSAPKPATTPAATTPALPPIPATPAGIVELVEVREFHLAQPYEHRFSKEKPMVDSGYIVVLRASSDLLAPRQVEMPVLMVGTTAVEPMNVGFASGTMVAIVPSTTKTDGSLVLDLSVSPIYFAPPMLPEQLDAAFAAQQLQLAERSGLTAQPAGVVQQAKTRAGAKLELADRDALNKVLGGLVRRYAADETEVADALEGKTDSTPHVVRP